MSETLDIVSFIERSRRAPVLDVRTPAEYAKGHLPGAYNLLLFSNEERAEIGTLYKQAGREAAMLRGLDLAGPKLRRMVEAAQAVVTGDEVLVHCWRSPATASGRSGAATKRSGATCSRRSRSRASYACSAG